ncbi:MAG TPA: hypothetical protein VIV40_14055 [Kofleriaceae bacterium]
MNVHRSIATARRLSASHPRTMLPCPRCAASVRAENLDKHLAKTHDNALGEADTPVPTFAGKDRILTRELVVVLIVLFVIATVVLAATGPKLTTTSVVIGGGMVLAVLTLGTIASLGLLPARVEIDGDRVRLRYALGLRTRTLAMPERIEVGRAVTMRPQAGMATYEHSAHEEVDDGGYVRLIDGKRRITVGCRAGTSFKKYWSSTRWSAAKPTRWIDITLGREAMVALEYELVGRGLLAPRDA